MKLAWMLAGSVAIGCHREPSPPAAASSAAPVTSPPVGTLVVGGPDTALATTQTSSGDILVKTPHALLRYAKGQTSEAAVTPLPEEVDRIATARNADVTAILAVSGAIYLAEGAPRATVRKITNVFGGLYIQISDDGNVVAVQEYVDSETGASLPPGTTKGAVPKTGVYDRNGKRLALADTVTLDGHGRFAATPGRLIPLDGSPEIAMPEGDFVGWAGDRAVFEDPRGIVIVEAGEKKSVPMCRQKGQRWLDTVEMQFVQLCGRAVEVVDLATKRKSTIALAAPAHFDDQSVAPSVEGKHLLAFFTQYGDPPKHFTFDIDPATNRAPLVSENEMRGVREWDGAHPDPSPPAYLRSGQARIRLDGDGLDIEVPGKPGVVRIGAGVATPLRTVPETSRPRTSACPSGSLLHSPLTTGELYYERAWNSRPRACICREGACQESPKGPFLAALGGAGDSLVLGSWGLTDTQIHVTDLQGETKGYMLVKAKCQAAVARADGKIAAVVCSESSTGPRELIELDLVTGQKSRSTPLVQRWSEIAALGPASVFASSQLFGNQYLVELEAGTGRRLATIYPYPNGAVVRFEDGRVEIDGDDLAAENAILCIEDGVARPFSTCSERLRVKDRYRVAR